MNVSSEIQPSSSTHSRLIIAICAAGPPQARRPNFKNRMKIERSGSVEVVGPSSFGKAAGFCYPNRRDTALAMSRGAGRRQGADPRIRGNLLHAAMAAGYCTGSAAFAVRRGTDH